jgi:MraZ protein
MATFTGRHELRIDQKGRVSVPSEYRRELGGPAVESVAVAPAPDRPALEAFDSQIVRNLSQRLATRTLSDAERASIKYFMEEIEMTAFDGEGRIRLSDRLKAHAGLADAALFVGQGQTFQIWNPAAHRARKAEETKKLGPVGGIDTILPLAGGPAGTGP